MKIDLLPEDEKIIADKLASGMYVSRSEVVRDALRRLAEYDRLIALRGPQSRPRLKKPGRMRRR